MAVIITQTPTSPNFSNTKLLYVASSSNATQPQFRYYVEIFGGSNPSFVDTLLETLRVYPNKEGICVVDLAPNFYSYIAYQPTDHIWRAPTPYNMEPEGNDFNFEVRIGEEYGTSISSSTAIYTGSVDNPITVAIGTVDYGTSGDYNFVTSSYISGSRILSNHPQARQVDYNILQEGPFVSIEDFQTLPFLEKPNPTQLNITMSAYTEGADPSNTGSLVYEQVYLGHSGTGGDFFNTKGVGPANLMADNVSATPWPRHYFESSSWLVAKGTLLGNDVEYKMILPSHSYYPCEDTNSYTRFTWLNKYGFWDYYNIYNPIKGTTTIDRQVYQKTFEDYNLSNSTYNINNRGKINYNTTVDNSFNIETNYISKPISDWLTEMFDSEEVFVYLPSGSNVFEDTILFGNVQTFIGPNSGFKPIVINDVNYSWQLDNNREKLFSYNINFEFSNKNYLR